MEFKFSDAFPFFYFKCWGKNKGKLNESRTGTKSNLRYDRRIIPVTDRQCCQIFDSDFREFHNCFVVIIIDEMVLKDAISDCNIR